MYEEIAQRVKAANCIIITAGAGMGVDSKLPSFRGKEGFWKNYIPFRDKFDFYECANPKFLKEHPKLFWGFYGHRLHLYRDTAPHQGFQVLQKWIEQKHFHVVTSNVDGHFQKSGFDQNRVYEIHGSINHMQCNSCQQIYSADGYNVNYNKDTFEASDPLPTCKNCEGVLIRPNILMFGDYSFLSDRVNKQEEAFTSLMNTLNKDNSVVIIEFGAGLAIPTIRNLGEKIFNQFKQATLIRVNPEDSQGPLGWKGENNVIGTRAFYSLKQGSLDAINSINSHL